MPKAQCKHVEHSSCNALFVATHLVTSDIDTTPRVCKQRARKSALAQSFAPGCKALAAIPGRTACNGASAGHGKLRQPFHSRRPFRLRRGHCAHPAAYTTVETEFEPREDSMPKKDAEEQCTRVDVMVLLPIPIVAVLI